MQKNDGKVGSMHSAYIRKPEGVGSYRRSTDFAAVVQRSKRLVSWKYKKGKYDGYQGFTCLLVKKNIINRLGQLNQSLRLLPNKVVEVNVIACEGVIAGKDASNRDAEMTLSR